MTYLLIISFLQVQRVKLKNLKHEIKKMNKINLIKQTGPNRPVLCDQQSAPPPKIAFL